jgi:hypothetical protein
MKSRPKLSYLGAAAVAVACGGLLVALGPHLQLAVVGIPVAVAFLVRAVVPSTDAYLTPSRVYLPILLTYSAVSLMIVHPATETAQIRALIFFSAAFWAADILIRSLARYEALPDRRGDKRLTIYTKYLWPLEVIGVVLMGATLAQHGVPILSENVAAVRVELASTATVFILATVALQITLVINLLILVGRIQLYGRSGRPLLHAGLLTILLISTSGRSAVLIPYLLAGIYLLLEGRRPLVPLAVAAIVAAGFFTTVGLFRSAGAEEGPLAPTVGYLTATSKMTDRIIRDDEMNRWDESSSGFLWIINRLSGHGTKPPGIELREAFGLELEGFGAEMGIIGALWFDLGALGAPIGGAIFGGLASLCFVRWRNHGRWWSLGYGYMLLWLLLTITQHPLASYWYVMFPLTLAIFATLNRDKTRLREFEILDRPAQAHELLTN